MKVWKPIYTAPRDGSHFLAYAKIVADEYDEDILIKKDVVDYVQTICYVLFGQIVQFPFNGNIVTNQHYLAWTELPENPSKEQFS